MYKESYRVQKMVLNLGTLDIFGFRILVEGSALWVLGYLTPSLASEHSLDDSSTLWQPTVS
jgi:hypothetical protein